VIYRVRVRDSYTLDSAQQGLARNRLYHPVVPAYPAIFLPSTSRYLEVGCHLKRLDDGRESCISLDWGLEEVKRATSRHVL